MQDGGGRGSAVHADVAAGDQPQPCCGDGRASGLRAACEGRRRERGNTRNGTTTKSVKCTFDALSIDTPRDRAVTFAPQLVKKRQTRLGDFEDKILVERRVAMRWLVDLRDRQSRSGFCSVGIDVHHDHNERLTRARCSRHGTGQYAGSHHLASGVVPCRCHSRSRHVRHVQRQ